MISEEFKNKVFNNIGYIGAVLAALAYGGWGLINLYESGKTVLEIIADVGIALAIGFIVVTLLKLQGLLKGKNSPEVQQVMIDFIKTLTLAVPYFKWLYRFVTKKNIEAYAIVRTAILSKRGLKYEDYFNDEGMFVGDFKTIGEKDSQEAIELIKLQNKAINKCLNLTITTLSPGDITSENGKKLDPLFMGEGENEWFTRTSFISFMITILMALLFGYFVPEFISLDKGALIWKGVQLISFTISGFVQMYLAYVYKTGVYKNIYIKKTNYLDELRVLGEKWEKEEFNHLNNKSLDKPIKEGEENDL